ncbi:diacylglycerol kinase epsilon-like [Macrosteles quadrilineatus]|uniref:diacylglycerol kinase epsilon-like n=1 Tax=Macrosteles quadrilineatus TaxID=74068 RepID=UPI0023E19741|nr:diacylglycerol kinase epsilon-like [Macrosteles quadrilineatus]
MDFIAPIKSLWDSSMSHVFFPVLAGISIIILTTHLYHHLKPETHVPLRDTKSHNWKSSKVVGEATHCSICENLLLTKGYYCDSCGVAADPPCLKNADKTLKCKSLSNNEKPMKHHWVKGNLPSYDHICRVCSDACDDVGLTDYQCCWCHTIVHTRCLPKVAQECDLGQFRQLIVPPYSVEVMSRRTSISHRLMLSSVTSPDWDDWSPLIVVANRKSGNNDGDLVLSCFRRLLNPAQVVDLAQWPPQAALEWCQLLGPSLATPAVVLVAGGDGTVGWVLNAIHQLKLKVEPVVGIVPLGTGNDLSRVLGWGSEHSTSDITGEQILRNIQRATPVKLDRWQVDVRPFSHIYRGHKQLLMYNYLSIGVDAQVTLDFHTTRESPFYLFSSRVFNKLLYLLFGTQQCVERRCQDLENKLELYLDGVKQELPEIESVVVLNIPSWGAGVDLWSLLKQDMPDLPEQSISDGKLEVVAVYSSFHIAQLQVGLSSPHYIGQASSVKIKLKNKMAMQVDGEPWNQQPAEINVNYVNQASVLQLEGEEEELS